MSKKHFRSPSCDDLPCGAVVNQRNRWFTGKFMTARAYRVEQQHFLSHRWLHNRMLHGWGVVHGLDVVPHPDPDCEKRWVVVRCGLALDCCGREVVLMEDTPLELPFLAPGDEDGQPGDATGEREPGVGYDPRSQHRGPKPDRDEDDGEPGEGDPGPDGSEGWLICLRYAECEREPVPALETEGSCDPRRSEANFVVQGAVLDLAPLGSFDDGCWRLPGGGADPECRDDCGEEIPEPGGSCFEPFCPCGSCVPLALIRPKDPERGWAGGFEIDLDGRHRLATPSALLTHVAAVNWPHGGELTLSELADDRGGRLEVRFDRRVRDADDEATGINEHTFVVQYGGVQADLELLASSDELGPTLADGCTAVFEIDQSFLTGKRTIAGSTLYITLKCDFILDCHGNPVDGEHLGGRLPSGNGTPGGTFFSWFRVVADGAGKERAT